MDKNWVVFGGWAIEPQILEPIFGHKAIYLDINLIIQDIIQDCRLMDNWAQYLYNQHIAPLPEPIFLGGWSTGAIIALALANQSKAKELVLLSSTQSFCRRPGFPHGTRPSVLSLMRNQLDENHQTVLNQFLTRCGINSYESKSHYSVNQLKNGLFFLEQADLTGLDRFTGTGIAFHGNHDLVIPVEAGRLASANAGCTFQELEGTHSFFIQHSETIKSIIHKSM
jgi:predicted esterase